MLMLPPDLRRGCWYIWWLIPRGQPGPLDAVKPLHFDVKTAAHKANYQPLWFPAPHRLLGCSPACVSTHTFFETFRISLFFFPPLFSPAPFLSRSVYLPTLRVCAHISPVILLSHDDSGFPSKR